MPATTVFSWLSGLTGAHALQFDRETERADFLATLLRSPSANTWWAIPADGGLFSDFGLLENVLLPAQTRGDPSAGIRLARWLDRLKACGVAPIPLNLPLAELSPWQARVTAFLRAVVADAPALVFDDTCYGLGPNECRQAILLHEFYHHYFPFRPTVYITLSTPNPKLNIPAANCHRHDNLFA